MFDTVPYLDYVVALHMVHKVLIVNCNVGVTGFNKLTCVFRQFYYRKCEIRNYSAY